MEYDLMDLTSKHIAEVRYKHIEEFAAAFAKKTDLDPEEIVMFQENVNDNNNFRIILKTWFARKSNEEVRIIEKLKEQILALENRLYNYEMMDEAIKEERRK